MAYGPIFPFSIGYDPNGLVYPGVHIGASAQLRQVYGINVIASLSANATAFLQFKMPSVIPTGTLTLGLIMTVNATSGDAKVNPTWAACALGANYNTLSQVAETASTITATAIDLLQETQITLDATTAPTAGEVLVMNLVFETSGWTIAAISTWIPYLLYV